MALFDPIAVRCGRRPPAVRTDPRQPGKRRAGRGSYFKLQEGAPAHGDPAEAAMTSPATVGAAPETIAVKSPRREPPEWLLTMAMLRHQYPDCPVTIDVLHHERHLCERVRQIFLDEQDYFYERFRKRLVAFATKAPDFIYATDPDRYVAEMEVDNEVLDIVVMGLVNQAAQGTGNWILKQAMASYGISFTPGDPRSTKAARG